MAHRLECPDSDAESLAERGATRREWLNAWPTGETTETDIGSLPAAGAVTSPLRISGDGDWLAVWGNFSGYRLGYSPRISFPILSGFVTRYPAGVDLFESRDPSFSGTRSVARFCSRQAALDFVASQGGGGASGGIVKVAAPQNQNRTATIAGEQTLIAANADRNGVSIQNVGAASFGIRLGSGNPTIVELTPGALYEFPAGICYTGEILTEGGVSTAAWVEF